MSCRENNITADTDTSHAMTTTARMNPASHNFIRVASLRAMRRKLGSRRLRVEGPIARRKDSVRAREGTVLPTAGSHTSTLQIYDTSGRSEVCSLVGETQHRQPENIKGRAGVIVRVARGGDRESVPKGKNRLGDQLRRHSGLEAK